VEHFVISHTAPSSHPESPTLVSNNLAPDEVLVLIYNFRLTKMPSTISYRGFPLHSSPDQPTPVAYLASNGSIRAGHKKLGEDQLLIEESLFVFLYVFIYLSLSLSVYYIFGINPLLLVGP
jgi:hypothetical protein